MEKYLNSSTRNKLNNLVNDLINSNEYNKVKELQQLMEADEELTKLIKEIKKEQKKYVRNNFNKEEKEKLVRLENDLNNNYIFIEYMYNLDIVNKKIEIIKEELIDYFSSVLN